MHALILLFASILPQFDIFGAGEQTEPPRPPQAVAPQPFTVAQAIQQSTNLNAPKQATSKTTTKTRIRVFSRRG